MKQSEGARRTLLSKVPEATALFWVIKILTTGMGETASDFIGNQGLVLAGGLVLVTAVALVSALVAQFRATRYVAPVYWAAVTMISVVGTMLSDGSRIALGITYAVSTVTFVVALAVIFGLWYRSERTLSIHSIVTRPRETFYWAAVVATFALGTSAGDLTARTLRLGFLGSGWMFLGIILVPAIAYRWLGLNAILAFWAAYVTTRPLGASFADWMAVPRRDGGLGWGTGPVTLVVAAVILALVGWVTWTRRDLVESLDVDPDPR
ncbi:MAG TPA: hypothetical protein VGP36_19595 [Mycobacteriales bacterium]|jgi:uncharacterized membrane-anchored protein|nr:hypothetical protein [Mycobacteriales bacterium]